MENQQFIAALKQIAAEKNISEEVVLDAVKDAFAAAYRKDFGNRDLEIRVEIQEDSPEIARIYILKEVVDDGDLMDENLEIEEVEAKKHDPDAEIGDEIYIDSTPEGYGRIAAQSAKQVILQKIQEASRKALFERFKDKEGDIIMGSINRVEGSHVFVDIDQTTVMLSDRNKIRNESYFPGKRMWFYLDRVGISSKGPQLIVSRTHKGLVKRVMEEEIPEVASGEVDIISIARDPGFRTKVSVRSDDPNTDPVGACIGQRGARIQPVMEEFSGERIDIIEHSDDPIKLIAKSLQPANIDKIVIVNADDFKDEETGKIIKKRCAVFVEEEDRAMAIGKKGQNIRLASELTGFEIDMYNIEEYEPFMKQLEKMQEAG